MKDLIKSFLREHIKINEQNRKFSTQEFIEKAKQVHGNKFSYDKTKYIGALKPVIITCPKHGDFPQEASSHLRGYGCRKCADELRAAKFTSNTSEFIGKAKQVHGDKYSYDKTEYIKTNKPVIITCPEHGDFLQQPRVHLAGMGCTECAIESKRGSTEEFIEKAKQVHGNRYSYDKTEYISSHKPVIITCPEHGDFPQTPSNHLNGAGCPKCAERIVAQKQTSNTEEFIDKSKQVHGDKYSYDKVKYKHNKQSVIINCPKHGDFPQTPNAHLRGQGCPRCNESKGEKFVELLLTTMNIKFIRQKKFIDCTNKVQGRYCRKLPFDFYLPDFNAVIEFDGQGHFQPISVFGGEKSFIQQQKYDNFKNQYCEEKGIKMIRIPYTMEQDNIKPFLKDKLGIK